MTFAINASNLAKAYRIGTRESRPETLAGALMRVVKAPLANLHRLRKLTTFNTREKEERDVIWALRDVTFQVEEGETLGVIGRNGAGKTTLLKVLAGITEPTSGEAEIRGRVASLLEVGTGFHPELTGRENVYLNGTILGMSRREVDRKFDEIVAFSEVERFLDTPIKWYSSGMAVRLAFSVAAHLEADILLVDEVLAVGDASFQKKCMGRMGDLASAGRTVIFVSHNMAAITHLCSRAIRIQDGKVVATGEPEDVVRSYLADVRAQSQRRLLGPGGTGPVKGSLMHRVSMVSDGQVVSSFVTGEPFELWIEIGADDGVDEGLSLGFQITDVRGRNVFGTNMLQYEMRFRPSEGPVTVVARVEELALTPGTYGISLFLGSGAGKDLEIVRDAIFFDVIWPSGQETPAPPQEQWGPLFMPVSWELVSGEPVRESL